jgi:hypothetical protein
MSQTPLQSLRAALTEQAVVNEVHAYVAAWIPASLARLPLDERPSEIRGPDDVARLAVEIARQRLDPNTQRNVLDVLEQLHPFFCEATARLSQLQTFSNPRAAQAIQSLFR